VLTAGQRRRVASDAASRLRASPRRAFVDVVDNVAREVAGVRVAGPVELADAATQGVWFEVAAVTASVRIELLRRGRLRGLVAELRALADVPP
jgi:hypothetical protein